MTKIYQPNPEEKQFLFFLFKTTFSILVESLKFYFGDYILPEGFLLIDILKEIIIGKFRYKKADS
jgi:hypothetical protein